MRQKRIKLGVLVLLAALLASLVIPAWAALPEKESSLTITFQYQSTVLPNGVFRAYRVAAASDTGKYPLTEKFLAYYPADTGRTDISGIEDTVGWNALAVGLENYVNNTKPAPDASGKTDSNGQLKFEGVKTTGLYLVMGDPLTIGRTVYTPQTFLVMIPGLKKSGNQYEYLYDVTSTVKVTAETRGGSGGGGTKPTPVNPTPVDPTPVDPTPVDPTPVDPTPDDPTPVDPVPDDGRYFEMEIPHTVGLLGHSDADVLTHALMDALLGAAALGDIGHLFPDSDPAYEGADSIALLREVTQRLKDEGWRLGNADITVLAQAPKLAPHIAAMRRILAEAMDCEISQVSVKATTEEGLGFTGAKEGIAAHAVVLIETI